MIVQPIKHTYKAVKFNKFDTQYLIDGHLQSESFLTERVKIEVFQGFSKAQNLTEYFRLRGETSWKNGSQVTGLWNTEFPKVKYGDRRTPEGKSLILFFRSKDYGMLIIYTFPNRYFPSRKEISRLISELK